MSVLNQHLSRQTLLQWLGFSVIAFFVLLVFYPSLMHVARADQIMYLAEVAHKQSWWDVAINTYNLNRHRQFSPGDEILFRPVMYFLLGSERFFFHYNFLLWQAVGIALHLGVVWFLLRFLLTVRVGWTAVIATGVFALSYINMEMIVWHHINGYMIFVIMLLIALRRWWLLFQRQGDDHKHLWVMGGAVLVGCFTYEVMNIYACLMALSLWILCPRLRPKALWIVLPVIVYAFVSIIDRLLVPGTMHANADFGAIHLNGLTMFENYAWTLKFWFFTSLFAVQLPVLFIARNVIAPEAQANLFSIYFASIGSIAALLLAGMIAVNWFKNPAWRRREYGILIILILVMILAYATVIVFGRVNVRGMWDTLRVNLYYNYVFIVLAVIVIFLSIRWEGLKTHWVKVCVGIIVAMFIITNSWQLYWANQEQAKSNAPINQLIYTLEYLIASKHNEPEFSFYVADNYPGNFIYKELINPNHPDHHYSFVEALYPQYFKVDGKYKLMTK